ncbi:MAG: aldolase/citrate lyase family protein [Phycisphaeraceae bacterium]
MKLIRKQVLAGARLFGTWCNLGSSLTVEMAGLAGLDWVLIDMEHGAGDQSELVHQLQAVDATPAAGIVRIACNDPARFKRVLDLGASGVMVPYVNTGDEAERAARAMRYPPAGVRGVARLNRASSFGVDFDAYFSAASHELLTIVQIETSEAVDNVAAIAGVEGVDVIFVGPLDLTTSMGIQGQYDHERFTAALDHVADAARSAGKAAGILLPSQAMLKPTLARGYSFVALGSDGGMVASGMRDAAAAVAPFRN